MKLIQTIFSGYELEATMTVMPKAGKDPDGKRIEPPTFIREHRSKIGNVSLVYNPQVFLTIRPRKPTMAQVDGLIQEASVGINQIYRFISMLTQVYNNSLEKGIYHEDKELYVDQKAAANAARRMSLYRYSITLFPDVITEGDDAEPQRAMGFQVDKMKIGVMSLVDVKSLIDVLDHLDLANYTMIAGMIDEFHQIQKTNDIIIDKLDRIERILGYARPRRNDEPLKWRSTTSKSDLPWYDDDEIGKKKEVV